MSGGPSRWARAARAALAAAAAAALAPGAAAHHQWLEPSAFTGPPGAPVALELRLGDDLPGQVVAARPDLVERLELVTAAGERPVRALPAGGPAGLVHLAAGGEQVVVLVTAPSLHELPGPLFEAYLVEEGLEAVSRRRAAAGRSAAPGREAWSRSLKLLLASGDGGGGAALHARPAGLPLELVPAASPAALTPGAELAFTLLRHGRPVPGALVEAVSPAAPAEVYSRRSDARGEVRFRFPRPGMWRLTAVHMVPAGRPDADWESVWSALTFAIGR